ncbi:hypothetical protein E2C01_056345 [Portunus trituberculatus]|uniref:Uncharacterized protein n=1 Tax=Portunus trituberculatus TaxID=210409 RepID=A0A5B7GTV2_PORTR|nr:hypothetical protein [Portunus trituberculatus]
MVVVMTVVTCVVSSHSPPGTLHQVSKSNQSRYVQVLSRLYDAPWHFTLLGTPQYSAHHFKRLLSGGKQC